VAAALAWLARHQGADGSWDSDEFSKRCATNICSGRGDAVYDVGVTALALLAFLGDGQGVTDQPHRNRALAATAWLMGRQDPGTGLITRPVRIAGKELVYGHALATLALCEALEFFPSPGLRRVAQRAVDGIATMRNPYSAWRYAFPPNGQNDTSITSWMLQALLVAREQGLEVDEAALKDGLKFLDQMTEPATGRTGYLEPGMPPAREAQDLEQWPPRRSESLTAAALFVRSEADPRWRQSDLARKAVDLMMLRLPRWDESTGDIDCYYWYYGSQALWQMGGKSWESWSKELHEALIPHQRRDGDEAGSWDPEVDPWGNDGGRVYSTALCCLALEADFRHARVAELE
jgi:hypothetical protein